MAAHSTPRAVLLDALGTLISFEPPAPRLRRALSERLGVDVGASAAEAAIRAEIAYYRAHLDQGRDAASLADLRTRCAEAMRPALAAAGGEDARLGAGGEDARTAAGREDAGAAAGGEDARAARVAAGAPTAVLTEALLDALRFFAFPDAAPALAALRELGFRTVVVSNWDHSLHERLEETGLAGLVDGALASAEVGSSKPARAIFDAALALAGTRDAWHVGDTPEADVEGALAAGLRPVLIDRDGVAAPLPGVPVIETLDGLLPLVAPDDELRVPSSAP